MAQATTQVDRRVLPSSVTSPAGSKAVLASKNPTDQSLKPSWKSLFASNWADKLLSYYSPNKDENGRISVTPPLDVALLGAGKWEGWLVGYFVDSKPPFSYVKSFLESNQKSFGKIESVTKFIQQAISISDQL